MVADLGVIPAQMLLDALDDLRGDVLPVKGSTDGDAHLVDIEGDAGHALDFVEGQGRLNRRGSVAVGLELESFYSRERVVQPLRRDALVDVEFADEFVRELLDDDTRGGHCGAFS